MQGIVSGRRKVNHEGGMSPERSLHVGKAWAPSKQGVGSKQARRGLRTPCLSSFYHSNLYEAEQPFKLKTHFAFNFKKYIYFCSS